LNLLLTNQEELVEDVKVRDRFDCRDHEVVQFRIQKSGNR